MKLICETHDIGLVEKSIAALLERSKLLAMSTVTASGGAWINTSYFSYDENLNLHVFTPPSSEHGINIGNNDSVAVAIFDSHQIPEDDKQGLQIAGTCARVTDEQMGEVAHEWATRMIDHDGLHDFFESLNSFESKFYRITPSRIKIFDEATFGEERWVEATVVHG